MSVDPISSENLCLRLKTVDRMTGAVEIYVCKAEDFDMLVNTPVQGGGWRRSILGTIPMSICEDKHVRVLALGRNPNMLFISDS